MEFLTSVTEILILAGAGWIAWRALADQPVPEEELIPIPVKDESSRQHR